MNMKYAIIALLALLIVSCAPSIYTLSADQQKNITWKVYDYTKDEVFDVLLTSMQLGTATLMTVDKELGIITTDWLQTGGALSTVLTGGRRTRTNFNIINSKDNSSQCIVRINMSYQTRSGSFGGWQDQAITKVMAEKTIKPFFDSIQERLTAE